MSSDASKEARFEPTVDTNGSASVFEKMPYDDMLTLLIQRTHFQTREQLLDVLRTNPDLTFKGLKPTLRNVLVSSLESNHPLRWSALKALMDDANLSINDRRVIMNVWIEASLQYMGITKDELMNSGVTKLKRGRVPPQLHHHLEEIYKAVTNHDSMRLPSLAEAELDDLARNGDTRYKQGSEQRMDIISYRAEHGLQLHHPADIKVFIDKD